MRAVAWPTDEDAIAGINQARQRLIELGWRDAIYCPKDGAVFDAIEAGSMGVHDCCYRGEWPNGGWWVLGDDDEWPSRPILFRLKAPDAAGDE